MVLPLLSAQVGLPLMRAYLPLVLTLVLEGISIPEVGAAALVYAILVLLGWHGSLPYCCFDCLILLTILMLVAAVYLLEYIQFVQNINLASGTEAPPTSQPSEQ